MKIYQIAAVFLVIIIVFSNCNYHEKNEMSEITSDNIQTNQQNNVSSQTEEIEMGDIPDTDQVIESKAVWSRSSDKSIDSLITTSYSEKDLIEYLNYFGSDNANTMMNVLDTKFPIECLRTPKDTLAYCVYKVKEGGLLYIFFHGDGNLKFADYAFLSKKLLLKDDFNGIKVGDSLATVEAIDEGTKIINSIKYDYFRKEPSVSLHLVKGGFMKIEYSFELFELSKFKVSSIQFVSSGDSLIYGQKYALFEDDYLT